MAWMSFPEIGLCHTQNSKIDEWMSFQKWLSTTNTTKPLKVFSSISNSERNC